MPPTDPQPGASRADVSMTPGSVLRLPMKSRPFRPMSSIWLAVIVADRSPLVVWTLSDSAATDTTSDRPPISSAIARQRQTLGGAEHDALLFVGLEPLDRHGEIERAGEEVRDDERPVRAGDRLTRQIGADVLDGDGGARHDAAASVGDDARYLAGQALGVRTCGRAGDDHRQCKHRATETIAHDPLLLSFP